jgi:hypothetical protein
MSENLGMVGWGALRCRQRFAPRALGLGDLGPHLTQRFETVKPSVIEYPHITRIAVIELFENVTHR